MYHELIQKSLSLLNCVQGKDRYGFHKEIQRIKRSALRRKHNPADLLMRIEQSVAQRAWRVRNLPQLVLEHDLPIMEKADQIISTIKIHPVVIISGDTGSGKSTRIPRLCLAAGQGIDGMIGCTQPRRIAALTIARRIAEETGEPLGKFVGYQIRFNKDISEQCFIKIMTDGILLAETQQDPFLNAYSTIIVDEAHERSLNIDFLLGILARLLKKRRDLRVIITSATIDTRKFSAAFGQAPVIEVSGRTYPVTVRYAPAEERGTQSPAEKAADMVKKLLQPGSRDPWGDMLVFMPTEADIHETCELLSARLQASAVSERVLIMPLFARLSGPEQQRVFGPSDKLKIIIATNVAETSLTIPGIKYVIDTGLVRIPQYLPRTRTTTMPVGPAARSSLDQRKGRCGRVAHGICIRLFSESDYQDRPVFTQPEIMRSNLAEVILRMLALNLGDIAAFPLIDKPAPANIKDGFKILEELGAIKQKVGFQLTQRGKIMARIPLDPCFSRMLLEARRENCLKQITVLAAALSIQDPRERPLEKSTEADQAHALFRDRDSDFLSFLKIWNHYHQIKAQTNSNNRLKVFCRQNYLSWQRMREWVDIYLQINQILVDQGFSKSASVGEVEVPDKPVKPSKRFSLLYAQMHRSILSGFLSNIALKNDQNFYKASGCREVMLFPGSGLFNQAGQWIVAAQMVETSRLFARINAHIDPGWLEALAGSQCRYTYLRPHWNKKKGAVMALEQVSLNGLMIEEGRQVPYGRIAPEQACHLFIQEALVEGDLMVVPPFLQHNHALIEEIRHKEDRIRRKDILVDQEEIFRFYEHRLKSVYDLPTLKKQIKKNGDHFLRMSLSDLLRYSPEQDELELFPGHAHIQGKQFDYEYHFEPGRNDDGVTLKVAINEARMVAQENLDWVVPGLLRTKIETLLKGLPKTFRKQLAPLTNTLEIILKQIPQQQQPLAAALSSFIHEHFKINIPASTWRMDALPDHLKMRISVTGPDGRVLNAGRDKSVLEVDQLQQIEPETFKEIRQKWEKQKISTWDFGDLPASITLTPSKHGWLLYPGLVAESGTKYVDLRVFKEGRQALKSHKLGVMRLFELYFARDLKLIQKRLRLPKHVKTDPDYFDYTKLEQSLYHAVVEELWCHDIRTQNDFNARVALSDQQMHPKATTKLADTIVLLTAFHQAHIHLSGSYANDLHQLIPPDFIGLYASKRIQQLERYIRAMVIRADKAQINPNKDHERALELKPFSEKLTQILQTLGSTSSDQKRTCVEELFWMLEEFKISLFAQNLKTNIPISGKRLEGKIAEINRLV